MTKRELLITEIEQVPEPLLDEVLDFVQFLKSKKTWEGWESAALSEYSLKKDWLLPQEEEAWRDL